MLFEKERFVFLTLKYKFWKLYIVSTHIFLYLFLFPLIKIRT